jgi:hypothetical protein
MSSLNPRWLSIEMAFADAAVNNWPEELKKSFEAASTTFHRATDKEEARKAPPDSDIDGLLHRPRAVGAI